MYRVGDFLKTEREGYTDIIIYTVFDTLELYYKGKYNYIVALRDSWLFRYTNDEELKQYGYKRAIPEDYICPKPGLKKHYSHH